MRTATRGIGGPADLDGDGDVDNGDLSQHPQSSALDAFIGDANYSADFDIDRDGSEDDIFDLLDYLNWHGPGMNTAALPEGQISETDAAAIPNVAVAPDNPIGYCGYVVNPEVRLYSVRRRWYSPELGQWLERDPAEYVDGPSMYLYGRVNSTKYVDPLGLQPSLPMLPLYGGGGTSDNDGGEGEGDCTCPEEATLEWRKTCEAAKLPLSGFEKELERLEKETIQVHYPNERPGTLKMLSGAGRVTAPRSRLSRNVSRHCDGGSRESGKSICLTAHKRWVGGLGGAIAIEAMRRRCYYDMTVY